MNKKNFSKATVWQLVSQFFVSGLTIITTPIFTRLLSTTEYGKLTNFNSWFAIIGVFLGFQAAGSIANAKVKYPSEEYEKYLSSVFSLGIISYVVAIIISGLLKSTLSSLIKVDEHYILLMFLGSMSSFAVNYFLQIKTQEYRMEITAIISTMSAIFTVLLSLFLVNYLSEDKYVGRIIGGIIPHIVVGIIATVIIYGKSKTIIDKQYWTYCLKLTVPLIFHSAASMILTLSDRVMINQMIGDELTAIYGVSYSMGSVMNIIWVAFNNAWIPFYYDLMKNKNDLMVIERSKGYILTFSIITNGFLLCVPEVFKFYAPQSYWSGLDLLPIITIATYFNFMYSFYGNFEFFYEKTKMISIGTIIAACSNLMLNYALIPRYGAWGAATATAICYGLLFVFHFVISTWIIKEKNDIRLRSVLCGFVSVIPGILLNYTTREFWVVRWGIAIALGAVLILRAIKRKSII